KEIERTRSRSSIQQSYLADNLIITNFTGQTIESEPLISYTAQKNITIINSHVDYLDMAGSVETGTSTHPVTYSVNGTTVRRNMYLWNARLRMSLCDIKVSGEGRFNYPQ